MSERPIYDEQHFWSSRMEISKCRWYWPWHKWRPMIAVDFGPPGRPEVSWFNKCDRCGMIATDDHIIKP